MMKTTLCYGDSNTWGFAPRSGKRFDYRARRPMVLWRLLNRGAPIFPDADQEDPPIG
jgi:hypothetical protein